MKTGYIYGLVDPRSPADIRYIGKTIDPDFRLRSHLKECTKQSHYRANWIRKLKADNISPSMIILEEIAYDPSLLNDREKYWIKYYRDMGFCLTNGTSGGDGFSSEDAKEQRRKRAKDNGELTIEDTKSKLLGLPLDTPRPTGKLGRSLSRYMISGSSPDADFHNSVRSRYPHWFEDIIVKKKKDALLALPVNTKRPSEKTDLGRPLHKYTSKTSSSYDPHFDDEIRSKQPQWFNKNRVYENKISFLLRHEMDGRPDRNTKMGKIFNNYLHKFPDFCQTIKNKNPSWFENTKNIENRDTE